MVFLEYMNGKVNAGILKASHCGGADTLRELKTPGMPAGRVRGSQVPVYCRRGVQRSRPWGVSVDVAILDLETGEVTAPELACDNKRAVVRSSFSQRLLVLAEGFAEIVDTEKSASVYAFAPDNCSFTHAIAASPSGFALFGKQGGTQGYWLLSEDGVLAEFKALDITELTAFDGNALLDTDALRITTPFTVHNGQVRFVVEDPVLTLAEWKYAGSLGDDHYFVSGYTIQIINEGRSSFVDLEWEVGAEKDVRIVTDRLLLASGELRSFDGTEYWSATMLDRDTIRLYDGPDDYLFRRGTRQVLMMPPHWDTLGAAGNWLVGSPWFPHGDEILLHRLEPTKDEKAMEMLDTLAQYGWAPEAEPAKEGE